MSLRSRLIDLLAEHGLLLRARGTAALADFVAVVRAEDDADDEDAEDAEDEDDDTDAEDGEGDGAGDDEEGEEAVSATRAIACPHCGERLEIAIDLTAGDQDAIQDCEVCCSPIRIVTTVSHGRMTGFHAEPA